MRVVTGGSPETFLTVSKRNVCNVEGDTLSFPARKNNNAAIAMTTVGLSNDLSGHAFAFASAVLTLSAVWAIKQDLEDRNVQAWRHFYCRIDTALALTRTSVTVSLFKSSSKQYF